MHMRRITLRYVDYLTLSHFSTLSHKRHDIRKKKKNSEHKMCVLISPIRLYETFIILGRNWRDMIKNVYWASCKLFPSDFKENYIFSKFSKNTQNSNFMKIRPVGAEFLHADRQRDRHDGSL